MKTKEEQAVELLANTIAEIMKNNNSDLVDSLPFDRTFVGVITAYKGKGVYTVSISGKNYDLPYLIGEDWDSALICTNEAKDFKGLSYSNQVGVNFKIKDGEGSSSSPDLNLRHCHVIQDPNQGKYGTVPSYVGNYRATSRESEYKGRELLKNTSIYYWLNAPNEWYEKGVLLKEKDTNNPEGNTPWGADGEIKATVSLDDIKAKVFRKNNPLSIGDKVVCKAPQNNKNDMYIEGRLSA